MSKPAYDGDPPEKAAFAALEGSVGQALGHLTDLATRTQTPRFFKTPDATAFASLRAGPAANTAEPSVSRESLPPGIQQKEPS